MTRLLYLDDDYNIIEEIQEINFQKDYNLDKLYFVNNSHLESVFLQSAFLQSITNILNFQKTYKLNHLDHSVDVIYTTSESNVLLIQSKLIEHINIISKNKLENLFYELKDDNVLSVFLEKRELVIEKKEKLLKTFGEYKTLSEILNNINSLNDLHFIK